MRAYLSRLRVERGVEVYGGHVDTGALVLDVERVRRYRCEDQPHNTEQMNAESQRAVDEFWARDLGMTSAAFADSRGLRLTTQRLYSGLQLFRQDERLLVAAPPWMVRSIEDVAKGLAPNDLFSAKWLQQFCGPNTEKILGPAEVNYADRSSFRYSGGLWGRKLLPGDSRAYAALVNALDSKEAEESGVAVDGFPAFGAFSNGVLYAVASYSVWEPSIAHIVVASHPDHRRRGFASAAVQSLAEEAFGRGLILQWRALSTNRNSLALAERLGFRHYCTTLFVRLGTDTTTERA